ncbi:MAG: 5-oxoprolinase subunit PxpB [Sulfurospirillaceae bacterium]|nr:5-oxoprolinase subunit PxpB [Sulfurospirillaceae bacterium]
MNFTFQVASFNTFMIYFGHRIDPQVSKEVQKAYRALKNARLIGVLEIIPSYASLMVSYDVLTQNYDSLCKRVEEIIMMARPIDEAEQKTVSIPSYYHPEVGLDLETVAEEKNLSIDAIIALHVNQSYNVYAVGFAPGFAYLGELNEALASPRLANPRKSIPKGSVSIADRQTAVYPTQSPGGWKILGRTPIAMFDTAYEGLSLLHVGDLVRFEAISRAEFLKLGGIL